MAQDVLFANELALDGVRYKLASQVQVNNITPFAPKQAFGDVTHANEILMSTWTLSSFKGGLLARRVRGRTGVDRLWDAVAWTLTEDELTLPLRSVSTKALTGYPQNATPLANGVNQVYPTATVETVDALVVSRPTRLITAFFDPTGGGGFHLRKWSEQLRHWVVPDVGGGEYAAEATYTPGSWATSSPIEAALPVVQDDAIPKIYYLFGAHTGLLVYYDSHWYWHNANASTGSPAPPCDRMVLWNSQVFALDSATGGFWRLDALSPGYVGGSPGGFTRLASLPVRAYECQKLLLFFNRGGDATIHAVTRDAVWAYDAYANKWLNTEFEYDRQLDSGYGSAKFNGDLYVSAGAAVGKFSNSTVQQMGLDRDWGLPAYRRGPIRCLASAGSWLAAGTDSSGTSNPVARAGVYLWDQAAWHHLWLSDFESTYITSLARTSADDKARIWYGVAGTLDCDMRYTEVPQGWYNPRDVLDTEFEVSGSAVTGWFDGDLPDQPKTAVSLRVRCEQASPTETVTFYYPTDDNDADTAWHLLGQVNSAGETVLLFNQGRGITFRTIRIKPVMSRNASSPTLTPILRVAALRYIRRPIPLYAHNATIIIQPEGYDGRDANALMQALTAVAASQTLVKAEYMRDGQSLGGLASRYVFVEKNIANVSAGEAKGRVALSLVEAA